MSMLTTAAIDELLERLPSLRIGVLGDLFLDRYLDIDASLTEPSVETGLDAYQVVKVRAYPGAAGTIINNLVALRVGHVSVLSLIGKDGEGHELKRELKRRGADLRFLIETDGRYTPTYAKPLLWERGVGFQSCGVGSQDWNPRPQQAPRELNRLDIRSRSALGQELTSRLVEKLPDFAANLDALIVLDQVREPETGVVTSPMRDRLAHFAADRPGLFILADSRYRIGLFRNVAVKPNRSECLAATGIRESLDHAVAALAKLVGGPVYCTCGEDGTLVIDNGETVLDVAAYPARGPIDPVGAGDSTSAGIACARAAGLNNADAAAFGNLVASITIQQIGTTGTATPEQVRERWREVHAGAGA